MKKQLPGLRSWKKNSSWSCETNKEDYYQQVQLAIKSSTHSRELSDHHAADHLSATGCRKSSTERQKETGVLRPGSWKAGQLFPFKTVKTYLIHYRISKNHCNKESKREPLVACCRPAESSDIDTSRVELHCSTLLVQWNHDIVGTSPALVMGTCFFFFFFNNNCWKLMLKGV